MDHCVPPSYEARVNWTDRAFLSRTYLIRRGSTVHCSLFSWIAADENKRVDCVFSGEDTFGSFFFFFFLSSSVYWQGRLARVITYRRSKRRTPQHTFLKLLLAALHIRWQCSKSRCRRCQQCSRCCWIAQPWKCSALVEKKEKRKIERLVI